MRFAYKFSRRIGGAGPLPAVLGSDIAPTAAAYLTNTNVYKTKLSAGFPSQRIAIGYQYTGAGPAPTLTAKGYVYDGTTEKWLTVDSLAVTIKDGDIAFIGIPQLIDAPQVAGGDTYVSTVDSVEFALVVAVAGGEPDGTYDFLLGMDISEVEDETNPSGGASAANQVNGTQQTKLTDGTHVVAVETAGADGASNTQNALSGAARLMGFNGVTWDRIRAGLTAKVASFVGFLNTLPYVVYKAHASIVARADGEGGPLLGDSLGRLSTSSEGARTPASADGTIVISDATTYDPPLRTLWCTGAGNVTLVLEGHATNTVTVPLLANVVYGQFRISKVKAAGTTATGISGAS